MKNFELNEHKSDFTKLNEQKAEEEREKIRKLNEKSKKLIEVSKKLIEESEEKLG